MYYALPAGALGANSKALARNGDAAIAGAGAGAGAGTAGDGEATNSFAAALKATGAEATG